MPMTKTKEIEKINNFLVNNEKIFAFISFF